MVLDDDPLMLKVMRCLLARLGNLEVFTFSRGEDAVRALRCDAAQYDLILCDLQMPEMDGVEFMRHLVELRYSGALVLVSAEDSRILQAVENLASAHSLDILGTLTKPPREQALARVLAKLIPASASVCHDEPEVRYSLSVLKKALAAGEFVTHYQPKVGLASGDFRGVECLVRWQHAPDDLVLPGQFLPSIEEHGLMAPLTDAVISSAMRDMRRWAGEGLDIHMAMNVSMSSLADLALPQAIERAAKEFDIPLSKIVLEVTETQLMLDAAAAYDILARLRLKRVGLAIDDFGVGHSSLAKLRDLPFNELKIDRSFVHCAHRNRSIATFLDASINLARQLGVSTVAEGVEDQADWDFLRTTACDMAQGWFIARAMPAADLSAWADSWERRRRAHSWAAT
jgi:EAL domain-containing protein (putative c-di-GMP-specific phosphodiesterase class I)/FixJ family two-component response regulator